MEWDTRWLLTAFNYLGIFVFAVSGAAKGMHKRADLVGIAIIAFVTSCSGGIMRDVLIGSFPPENILKWEPLAASMLGAAAAVLFYPILTEKLNKPGQIFDAFGIGLFTIIGSQKALAFHVHPVWAILLGVFTAVGGGMARDILLARVPYILRKEVYATACIAGSTIYVLGALWPVIPVEYSMVLGAAVCISLRLVSLRFNWNLPSMPVRR